MLLEGTRVAFVGRLGGVNRKEAQQIVRRHGAACTPIDSANLIVVGADEMLLNAADELLTEAARARVSDQLAEVITETQLWERLGMVPDDSRVRNLYTPAMLAQLVEVPLPIVRRWHRRGLIVPVEEVHRLPYFDFQQVATARQLAQLLAAGESPAAIEKKIAALERLLPDLQLPLAQLSVIVEGRQLLLRQGEGLVESTGQMRFDFEAMEGEACDTLVFARPDPAGATAEQLLETAFEFEEHGQLDRAADAYRRALAHLGPSPELCFQLAEVLYRQDDLAAARERYHMALEMDPHFVEARANLGCVLGELGNVPAAIEAFLTTLEHHPDYPDVHYHLASLYESQHESQRAKHHWQAFLNLSPDSPWADQARDRLAEIGG